MSKLMMSVIAGALMVFSFAAADTAQARGCCGGTQIIPVYPSIKPQPLYFIRRHKSCCGGYDRFLDEYFAPVEMRIIRGECYGGGCF